MATTQEKKIVDRRTEDEWPLFRSDALLYDTFEHSLETADDEAVTSPAIRTSDCMQRVWGDEYDACYVSGAPLTGNPNHAAYNGAAHVPEVIEVWTDNWSDDLRTVPPEPITDAAIDALVDHDKVLVHYVQPHVPSSIGMPHLIGEKGHTDAPVPDDDYDVTGVMQEIKQAAASGALADEDLDRAHYNNCMQAAKGTRPLIDASNRRTASPATTENV